MCICVCIYTHTISVYTYTYIHLHTHTFNAYALLKLCKPKAFLKPAQINQALTAGFKSFHVQSSWLRCCQRNGSQKEPAELDQITWCRRRLISATEVLSEMPGTLHFAGVIPNAPSAVSNSLNSKPRWAAFPLDCGTAQLLPRLKECLRRSRDTGGVCSHADK